MQRRLKNLSSDDVGRILRKAGFKLVRQHGSHLQYSAIIKGEKRRVTVIAEWESYPLGTLKSMIAQSGLSEEEWLALK